MNHNQSTLRTTENYQATFQRHEKKYALPKFLTKEFLDDLKSYMQQDEYGHHTISSIYYDTQDFKVAQENLKKPDYKEKMRLRTYGCPNYSSPSFIELKKKFEGITYKRRASLSLEEAEDYLNNNICPSNICDHQVLKEVEWFRNQFDSPLIPQTLIAYDRDAFFGLEDSEVRLTIDQNIRWRDSDLTLAHGSYGAPLCQGVNMIEIKVSDAFPLWLAHLLSKYELYPTSFSKYTTIYSNYLFQSEKEAVCHVG